MNKSEILAPAITIKEYLERYDYLHRKVYSTPEPEFDSVTTHIYKAPDKFYTADHCLVHDNGKWHLFYVTGEIENCEKWKEAYEKLDLEALKKYQIEPGDGHAVGDDLNSLEYKGLVLDDQIGDFDISTRGNSHIVRYKDHWVALYQARGIEGASICAARSDDLYNWIKDKKNPAFTAPDWAYKTGQCKDVHIVPWKGAYLVYYITQALDGLQTLALKITEDFEKFEEVGPVFKGPSMARGTRGLESPCIHERDGMWHLFIGWGIYGVWHVVSMRPDTFTGAEFYNLPAQKNQKPLDYGVYAFAPFHAAEIVNHNGEWFATTTIKEELRRRDCDSRILKYRGSLEDELKLTHGLYMSRISWDNDFPVCMKP